MWREKELGYKTDSSQRDWISSFTCQQNGGKEKGGKLPWRIGTRLSRVHIQQCLDIEPSRTPSLQLAGVGFLVA